MRSVTPITACLIAVQVNDSQISATILGSASDAAERTETWHRQTD
jgi:hypothetical protein